MKWTPETRRQALSRTLRDVIASDLDVLFCGINPGLYSAATGWHFTRPRLERKVRRYRPRAVAIVGIGAYRIAFGRPRSTLGRQPDDLAGALLWVLPNTSGLNAHYQAAGFAEAFAELRCALDARPRSGRGRSAWS